MTKKKKKYKSKGTVFNNMNIAKYNVSMFNNKEVNEIIDPLYLTIKKAYLGGISYESFTVLTTSVAMAKELEIHSGIHGFDIIIDRARTALASIQARCMYSGSWLSQPCRKYELDVFMDFIASHRFQLKNCTKQEIKNCTNLLKSKAESDNSIEKVSIDLVKLKSTLEEETSSLQLPLPYFETV